MKRSAILSSGVLVACLSACGPSVSLRVEQRSIKDLPLESRLDLLDAENDLFSAVDRRDDAEAAIDDARAAVRKADARVDEADRNLDQAKERRDQGGVDVGRLAILEAKAHRKVKEWELRFSHKDLDVAEAQLLVAEGRFEKSKAEVAKRAKTPGAAELKVQDFDKQVERLLVHVKSVQKDADATHKDAEKDQAKWQALSRQLSELTGGAQGSAWVQ
jgi:peptidoglycan hydrolase CwlO-like protein